MCELFAAALRCPLALNAQLSTFFGDSTMHPHGWGLALRMDDGSVSLHKEARRAIDSRLLHDIMGGTVRSTHVLAHIRYATAGEPSYDNTHPFLGRDAQGTTWAFAHNGSIFRQELIAPYERQAHGSSDSERVLLYLLAAVDRAERDHAGETDDVLAQARFDALSQALAALSSGNKLNVILDDGTRTYVHTNTEDDTLWCKQAPCGAIFCTRPLDDAGWQPVPKCRLVAYHDGQLEQVGPQASATYHFDQDQLEAFMLAHAA